MDETYVKIYRKITEWEWYKDPVASRLYHHLIYKANRFDKRINGVLVKKGEVLTSLSLLAEQLALSIQEIRTGLKKLRLTSEITSKSTNKHRLIFLVNYETYQIENGHSNKQTNKQTNKQATGKPYLLSDTKESKEEYKDQRKNSYKCIVDNEIVGLYNDLCKNLKPVIAINADRITAIKEFKEFMKDKGFNISQYFTKCNNNSFLAGKNKTKSFFRGRGAGFDFIIRTSTVLKVFEGAYNDNEIDTEKEDFIRLAKEKHSWSDEKIEQIWNQQQKKRG